MTKERRPLIKILIAAALGLGLFLPTQAFACSHMGRSMTSRPICRACQLGGYVAMSPGATCSYQRSARFSFCDCVSCMDCRSGAVGFTMMLNNYSNGICVSGTCANTVLDEPNEAYMYDKYNKACDTPECGASS
jgi:hypothetical protein